MADTLLIHFNPQKPDNATWSVVNSAGELTTMITMGSLSDAAPIAEKHKTVVLLDNTSIHISSVKLPVKNRQKLLRAIPFALEEEIADDVDDLHFVTGKQLRDGSMPVAAIKKETLNVIMNAMNTAGIKPVAIVPDSLCLTANDNQWAILIHENQANLQLNTFKGSEFDCDILITVITALVQQDTPEKIILFTQDGKDESELALELKQSLPENVELISVTYNTNPLVIYCGQYHNAIPLNLLQEAYKPERKSNVEWQRWRLAASLAVIWLVISLGSAGTELYKLQDKNNKLRVQIESIYKSSFPESRKIVNARVQMEQKLNELKGNGGGEDNASLITLLSNSANALSSGKDVTLQSINYRNNKMDMELTATTLHAIEALNKKINRHPIKSEIVSSSSEKDLVKGNIRVHKAGS